MSDGNDCHYQARCNHEHNQMCDRCLQLNKVCFSQSFFSNLVVFITRAVSPLWFHGWYFDQSECSFLFLQIIYYTILPLISLAFCRVFRSAGSEILTRV